MRVDGHGEAEQSTDLKSTVAIFRPQSITMEEHTSTSGILETNKTIRAFPFGGHAVDSSPVPLGRVGAVVSIVVLIIVIVVTVVLVSMFVFHLLLLLLLVKLAESFIVGLCIRRVHR
jgi:hypothetical protein